MYSSAFRHHASNAVWNGDTCPIGLVVFLAEEVAVGEFLVKIKPYISTQDESRDESAWGAAKEEEGQLTDRTLCADY